MWPFDAIKRLTQQRDEAYVALVETKAALGSVADRCTSQEERIRQLQDSLKRREDATASLQFRADELAAQVSLQDKMITKLNATVDKLKAQLAEAQKNDTRGAKGRFTKKEPKADV